MKSQYFASPVCFGHIPDKNERAVPAEFNGTDIAY